MRKSILKALAVAMAMSSLASCSQSTANQKTNTLPESVTLTKEVLMDKVKGG